MPSRPIYPEELLALADELVGRGAGSGRPRTIRLRRGISTAYYAVFHELSAAIVVAVIAPQSWDARAAGVARWIAHTDLAALSRAATGSGNKALRTALGAVSQDTERIAQAFLDLQDERHQADYDDLYEVTRAKATSFVDVARDAVARSNRLTANGDADYKRFLALGLGAVKIAKDR